MGRGDEELVEACRAGEGSAFDELVARWEDRIRGASYRILGSEDEARDVAQEAFLKAYRGLAGFKREARFSSWLYQIATNLCRDRPRPRRPRPPHNLAAAEAAGAAARERAAPADEPRGDRGVGVVDRRDAAGRAGAAAGGGPGAGGAASDRV